MLGMVQERTRTQTDDIRDRWLKHFEFKLKHCRMSEPPHLFQRRKSGTTGEVRRGWKGEERDTQKVRGNQRQDERATRRKEETGERWKEGGQLTTDRGIQINKRRTFLETLCWWRGTVVERRSLTGELSLSCARPAADGWPLMWVNRSAT